MPRVRAASAPADYPGCPVTIRDAIARGEVLQPPRWGLWDVTWGLIAAFVVSLAVAVALYLADAPIAIQVLVGVTTPWVVLAGWPLLCTARRGNGPILDLGLRLTWHDARWGALGGLVALIAAGIVASITQVFAPDLTSAAADAADEIKESGRLVLMMFALIVMVGAPIVEELFFRGLFYGAVRKAGASAVWTIVITAVVFAAFHVEPVRFFILLPTGLVLGWVRWKTGSTGAAMVTHGLVNAPGAILLLLGVDGMSP
jgi:membrane protease YdiL (CAAX protease family)